MLSCLPDQAKERPRDLNELAASIVGDATGQTAPESPKDSAKNPHAIGLGRLRGKKGGAARATKLTRKRRKEIAKKAAYARWARH